MHMAARADHQLFEAEADPKKLEAKRKSMAARRKVEIIKMRAARLAYEARKREGKP